MALENSRAAWVNRSSTDIPVYSTTVSSQVHAGGITAGGTRIGLIYPNEFYSLIPNDSDNITCFRITFRNGNGVQTDGYIETSRGTTLGDYAWVAYQEPYHFYNSNGSSLIDSAAETIRGDYCRVFTVNKSVSYYNTSGIKQGTLSVGTKLATDCSTTGQTHSNYMLFMYQKPSGGSWTSLQNDTYGFVDLSYSKGTMPNDRAIR